MIHPCLLSDQASPKSLFCHNRISFGALIVSDEMGQMDSLSFCYFGRLTDISNYYFSTLHQGIQFFLENKVSIQR